MKFFLLKTLLLNKGKDEGFTLPIVMATGLVMLLLSLVNLAQSSEEQIIATSRQQSSDALAAAEIGVGRYRDLLLNNRILAINNLDDWDDPFIVGGGGELTKVCTDLDDLADWRDTANWRPIAGTDLSYRLIQYEYDRDGNFGDADNDGLLDDTTPENNQFSQIADNGDPNSTGTVQPYDPVADNHNDLDGDLESDARGILTVRGRDISGSVAQIQVAIPIGVNARDISNLAPALWVQQNDISLGELGNISIDSDDDGTPNELEDGNIVLYQPGTADTAGTAGADGCTDAPATLGGINVVRDARPLPPVMNPANFTAAFLTPLPTPPALSFRELDGDIDANLYTATPLPAYPANFFNTANNEIVLGTNFDNTTGGVDDPTGSDRALNSGLIINGETGQEIYYYRTDAANLVLEDGEAIVGDGNVRVILYVDGNLEINTGANGVRIVNSAHESETPPDTASEIGRYLEVHVRDNVNITGDGTVDLTGLLRVGGRVDIANTVTLNMTGSIWANNWDAGTATINIDTDQSTVGGATVSEYNFYSVTSQRIPAPVTYQPTGWETQEATP